jgi:uncharacterized protein (TIGR02246 family)
MSRRTTVRLGMLGAWVVLAAPLNGQDVELEIASWLAGCWAATSETGWTEEVWSSPGGGLMLATSRTVRGGRATGYEFVVLRAVDGELVYTAHPSGQATTDFRGTVISDVVLRFENPEHDFPKAIEYRRTTSDSIRVHVFGELASAQPAFSLSYGRRSCDRMDPRPAQSDEQQIAGILTGLTEAWNRRDAAAWVASFTESSTFTNILGMHFPDRAANEARHDELFRTIFRNSHLGAEVLRIRVLGSDAAVAELQFELRGHTALPPGIIESEPGLLRTRLISVLEKRDGRWWIVAAQNTVILPGR